MKLQSRISCEMYSIYYTYRFLAHPVSQAILGDLWMGGLRMRKNTALKIVLGKRKNA